MPRQDGPRQTERIEVRHGRLRLRELVFELPPAAGAATAKVQVAGQAVPASLRRNGAEARLVLEHEVTVREGSAVEVTFQA